MRKHVAIVVAVAAIGWTGPKDVFAGSKGLSPKGQQVLARFDINKDGKIDSQERVASKLAVHQRSLAISRARNLELQARASQMGFSPWGNTFLAPTGSGRRDDCKYGKGDKRCKHCK